MSKLSSWLGSHLGSTGKVLNTVGKVLPSTGQLIGGAALGPIGATVGGMIDPHTTGLQKGIGYGVDALAGGLGGASALAGGGALSGLAGKLGGLDLGGILKGAGSAIGLGGAGGGLDLGKLADAGLGTAALVNQSKLQGQSTDYATNAFKQAQDAYNSRAGLRTAGVAGLLNPQSGVDLSALKGTAGAGNPFSPRPSSPPRIA